MAALEDGGDCVYVTRALLDALERDKRALKWELARAAKTADVRAAQLAACEAQVKDLMTIVEMNKSVAHKAVQRSYAKEGVLQRLHRERVQLQTRVETHQRHALAALERRVTLRRQRDALQTWKREVTAQRQRRELIRRIARSRRRRWLREGVAQWRRIVRPTAAKRDASALVYPISPQAFAYGVPEKTIRPTVRFALTSPTSSTRSDSTAVGAPTHHADCSRKSLSFTTWKAQWLAQRRRHATAIHFARLMLAKRVLTAWKHVVRRRNWREAMVTTAIQRRRYQCFVVWRVWTTRRRRAIRLLGKLSTRATARCLRHAFVRLRIRCLEKCMSEWGEVLKDARQALDEERRIYSLQQSEAMQEIEKKASQEQRRQAQFTAAQLDVIQNKLRLAVLTRCLAKWQRLVVFRGMQARVADQFRRHRQRGRVVQKLFTVWKASIRQSRAVKRFSHRRTTRDRRKRLVRAFRALATTTKRLMEQKRALRQVLRARRIVVSSRAFWRWRGAIALADEQVNALLQQRQLANQLKIRESASHNESQRLRRVGYMYQMKCALVMGDIKIERHTRKVFSAWKTRVQSVLKRKRALRNLCASTATAFVKLAFGRWRYVSDQSTFVQRKLQERATHQRRQIMRSCFTAWRSSSQRQIVSSAQASLQFVTFLLWRKRSRESSSRRAALATLLKFRLRYRWAKPAFDKWRRKTDIIALTERRTRERELELLQRTYHRLCVWFARRSRRRRVQFDRIAARAEARARHRLLLAVLVAWRNQVRVNRNEERDDRRILTVALKSRRWQRLHPVWQLWMTHTRQRTRLRSILRRIATRLVVGMTLDAWHCWKVFVANLNGIRVGEALSQQEAWRMEATRYQQTTLRRMFYRWHQRSRTAKQAHALAEHNCRQRRREVLVASLIQWRRSFVPAMQCRRLLLRGIVDAHRKAWLRLGIQTWRRQAVHLSLVHHQELSLASRSQAQSKALVFLRRMWTVRDLRTVFLAWQSHCQQSRRAKQGLKRLMVKKATGLLRFAWAKMTRRVAAHATLGRLARLRTQVVLRRAWCQLLATASDRAAQKRVLTRLCTVIKKAAVRFTWMQWKRRDHALLFSLLTSTHTATNSALQAFMERVGVRQFTKSLMARVFGNWKAHASRQRALRQRVVQLLTRQDSLSVKRCFQSWACELDNQRNARRSLRAILTRRSVAMERLAVGKWRAFAVETAYQAKLVDARRQLKAHREAVARRVAMTMFAKWQTPSLASMFRAWKAVVGDKRHTVDSLITRRSSWTLKVVWAQWRDAVVSRKSARTNLTVVLMRRQRSTIREAWRVWHARMLWLDCVEVVIKRLFTSVRLRQLRSAWRLLRLHQDMVMRRQSMMVVVSAQQQLNQQNELQRLRGIAFLLQRQQKGRLRERVSRWRDFVAGIKDRKAILKAVSCRYSRRTTRSVLRAWRDVISRRQIQARRIGKWQKTHCQSRLLRSTWRAWDTFAARRVQARLLFQRILERRVTSVVSAAWTTWVEIVEEVVEAERAREITHWGRATTMQQNQVASLEAKTELLLLESVELKRAMHSQRWRCAEAFMRKTLSVLDAASTRQVQQRFTQWAMVVDKLHAARWLCGKIRIVREREGFLRWKQEAQRSKSEAQMLEKVALILSASSTLAHKKNTWTHWVAYANQRRAKRTQQRVVDMLRRRQGDGPVLRCAFGAWKIVARDVKHRRLTAVKMETVTRRKLLRIVLSGWLKWREHARSQREASLMLCRIDRAIQRRCLLHKWLRWRNSVAETAVVVAQSHVVVMQTETAEREEKQAGQTVLLRVFTAWRETTAVRSAYREDLCAQHFQFDSMWTKRRVMDGWRRLVDASKLQQAYNQRPVLCVRANVKTKRHQRPGAEHGVLMSFAEYVQHRHRTHWRVQLSRRVTQKRLRRFFGLAWLLRSLRRQHLRAQRRALWRWFAKVQSISCALSAVSFAELPWRRGDVDFAGSMLLLTLEELDLARQTHYTERTQRAWSAVDAIVRSQRRQAARRAFDKWRWGRQKRPASARGPLVARRLVASDRTATNTERARARACIAQLVRVQLRRAFAEWKALYLALALQQAQAEHDALQDALTLTATRRRAMDAQASS